MYWRGFLGGRFLFYSLVFFSDRISGFGVDPPPQVGGPSQPTAESSLIQAKIWKLIKTSPFSKFALSGDLLEEMHEKGEKE